MTVFVLSHGWGFGDWYWERLAHHLSAHGKIFFLKGVAQGNDLCYNTKCVGDAVVGIGHSLGVHKLRGIGCDAVVALQSFGDFLGGDHRMRGVRSVFLSKMMQQYQSDARACIQDFVKSALGKWYTDDVGEKCVSSLDDAGYAQLWDELQALQNPYDVRWLEKVPLLSIYSRNDRIVPAKITCAAFASSVDMCSNGVGDGAHALGFAHSKAIAQMITAFLCENGL